MLNRRRKFRFNIFFLVLFVKIDISIQQNGSENHPSINESLLSMKSDIKDTYERILAIETKFEETLKNLSIEIRSSNEVLKNCDEGIQQLVSQESTDGCSTNNLDNLQTFEQDIKSLSSNQEAVVSDAKKIIANDLEIKKILNEIANNIKTVSDLKLSVTKNEKVIKSVESNLSSEMKTLSQQLKKEISSLKENCSRETSQTIEHQKLPKTCAELMNKGETHSGIYQIQPGNQPFFVFCDMKTMGGGWTVFQNRFSGEQNFDLGWTHYEKGFGNVAGEYWLGLEKIHAITQLELNELVILLEDFNGVKKHAKYSTFGIGSQLKGYSLEVLGKYSGDANDSLSYHAGMGFTTSDKDNDEAAGNCAISYSGPWWHKNCLYSNLNGLYLRGKTTQYAKGMCWEHFKGRGYSLKTSRIMVRPKRKEN